MRRIGSSCFARALNGQATAAPMMNSRRLIASPKGLRTRALSSFKLAHGSRTMNANPKRRSAASRELSRVKEMDPMPLLQLSDTQIGIIFRAADSRARSSQPAWEDH